MKIVTAKKILKANDQLAAERRNVLNKHDVFCVNLVGSPGAGKTALLESLFEAMGPSVSHCVIEGDIAGQVDAERIEKRGVPVVQINTEGMCHLDANMVAAASEGLALDGIDVLWIENVGNLVCTAGYDLGEHLRLVALSTPEGDDKIVKYPAIFQRSNALVVTKIDLLSHLDFDVNKARADMKRLAPTADMFEVAAIKGQGVPALAQWLLEKMNRMEDEKVVSDRS